LGSPRYLFPRAATTHFQVDEPPATVILQRHCPPHAGLALEMWPDAKREGRSAPVVR